MRRSFVFLVLFLAGFLFSSVLTPLVRDPAAVAVAVAAADGLGVGAPSPPLYLPAAADSGEISAPAAEWSGGGRLGLSDLVPVEKSRPSRSLLSFDKDEQGRFLLALSNGTIYFVNRSTVPQWKLMVGAPLTFSWRDPTQDDSEYYLYSGKNGDLYEYSKDAGARKHNLTVEEYVLRTPVVKGSVITTGTKTSTFYVVDADSGELVYTDNEPFTWTAAGVRRVEERSVASKLESGDANYITIIRTDYYLESFDLGKPLWSVMVSRISAYNVGPGLPPSMGDEVEMSNMIEKSIPVYFPRETGQSNRPPDLMLPSSSDFQNPDIWNAQESNPESDFLPHILCNSANNCSLEINMKSIIDKALDDGVDSSSGLRDLDKVESGCPLENCIVAKPSFSFFVNDLPHDKEKISNASESSSKGVNDHTEVELQVSQQKIGMQLQSMPIIFAWFIPLLLILTLICYLMLRNQSKDDKEQNSVNEGPSVVSKRRKSRKTGTIKNGVDIAKNGMPRSSEKGKAEINGHNQSQSNLTDWFTNYVKAVDAGDGRQVGRLFVSNSVIGRGSNGTVVFEGVYDGRPVAVKRLLRAHHDVAFKEIQNLIASDRHPNIVRWYGVEQDLDFVYVSLERCICSLSDLIQMFSDSHTTYSESPSSSSLVEHKVQIDFASALGKDINLWRENGLPSSQLLKLMRDVVSGLVHLHELGIIHRDLKPQNVLISNEKYISAKLSDMGISKRLLEDMSSLSHHATGYGSSGWQAPEQLLHGRQTRAVDLFSLGCILFFCITKGKHPFGNYFERDSNIINNKVDLFLVDHMPEAEHLISQLLDPDPKMRPNAVEVFHHPFFWDSELRLSFLRDTSDRVELEDRENEADLLKALESTGPVAFGGKWNEKLDAAFITDMGRYRKYKFECVRDLLRVIRNKLNHYRELPKELQEILGPVPEGFDTYFTSRFPKLLIEVYKVIQRHCKEEDTFCKYFKNSII